MAAGHLDKRAAGRGAALELVSRFQLEPLEPEGGFFRRTHYSTMGVTAPYGERRACNAIMYLMFAEHCSNIHRLKMDEVWHFYSGDPMVIVELDVKHPGQCRLTRIGSVAAGHSPQHQVQAGTWFGAYAEGTYSFVGCSCGPAFEFEDFEIGRRAELLAAFPEAAAEIRRLSADTEASPLAEEQAPPSEQRAEGSLDARAPAVYEHRVTRRGAYDEHEEALRILLDGRGGCLLAQEDRQTDRTACAVTIQQQWNVLRGTYTMEAPQVVRCTWSRHLQRDHYEQVQDIRDTNWAVMDGQASVKWMRLDISEWQQLEEAVLEECTGGLREGFRLGRFLGWQVAKGSAEELREALGLS